MSPAYPFQKFALLLLLPQQAKNMDLELIWKLKAKGMSKTQPTRVSVPFTTPNSASNTLFMKSGLGLDGRQAMYSIRIGFKSSTETITKERRTGLNGKVETWSFQICKSHLFVSFWCPIWMNRTLKGATMKNTMVCCKPQSGWKQRT